MALKRSNDITPEEHLLRLIEKPTDVGDTQLQKDDLTIVEGKKGGAGIKWLSSMFFSLPMLLLKSGGRLSLKTVNHLCLVVITILLGYAIGSVVLAKTPVIPEPEKRKIKIDEIPEPPDINDIIRVIDNRDIFMDVSKPVVVEPPKPNPVNPTPTTVQPPAPEIKPPISEVLRKLKLIGIIWEPKPPLVLINDESRTEIHCVKEGESFVTKVEQSGNVRDVLMEIKEITKDKVMLRYENEEGTLVLTD